MKQIVLTAVALTFTVSAGQAFAQDAAKGKQVFTDQKCGLCHSVAGQGNKKGPLDGVATKMSAADMRAWITNAPDMAAKAKADRKPPMKAYTDLSKDDVDSLVAYLQSLKK
jgi:mono/diheme cytochrome c family protein